MFPHLYAMKEVHHLSSEDMGAIIGKSRQTYEYKAQCGNFTPFECKALCRHFHKSFDYLFATMDEIDRIDRIVADGFGFVNGVDEDAGADSTREDDVTEKSDADHADVKQEAG